VSDPTPPVPLFMTRSRLWSGFLILNVLVAPVLALLAHFVGGLWGENTILMLTYVGSAIVLLGNFALWAAARRLRMPGSGWMAGWTTACLVTLMILAAATPLNVALAYFFALPMGNLSSN